MIKVAICDANRVMRGDIRGELERASDIEVVGEVFDRGSATALIRSTEVHVLILGFEMSGQRSVEVINHVRNERPCLRIVALTTHSAQTGVAISAFRAGASGFLINASPAEELLEAIRKVSSGGLYISLETPTDTREGSHETTTTLPHLCLSDREFHVFLRIACGQSLSVIAETLGMNATTISTERTNILQKMELPNDAALVRYATIHEFIQDESFRTL